MAKFAKNNAKIQIILVSVVLLMFSSTASAFDKDVHHVFGKLAGKLIGGLANKFPNNLYNKRHLRMAIMLHIAPQIIYWRLTKKYKKQIKKNERMRKKYRTIIPVSILPQLAYMRAFNREKNSEYYVVGADESGDQTQDQKPRIPLPEIPEETKEAYEKGSMLSFNSMSDHETMFHNSVMAEQDLVKEASSAEGKAISQAQLKNQQSILDMENEMNEIQTHNKVHHISHEKFK